MDVTHLSTSQPGTYAEWRVSGHPDRDDTPYEFVWSPLLYPAIAADPDSAEKAARAFVENVRTAPERSHGIRSPWKDGPHLSQRTVTITEWRAEQ